MKYKNKYTGVIVSPASNIAKETFEKSSAWEPYPEEAAPVDKKVKKDASRGK